MVSRRSSRSQSTEGVEPTTNDDAVESELDAVRNGDLSASQVSWGNGNVDPNEPDAQYPPGVVQRGSRQGFDVNPSDTVPERKRRQMLPTQSNIETARTTDATPDYSTKTDE